MNEKLRYNNGSRIMLEILNNYVHVIVRQRLAQLPGPLTAAEYQSLEAGVLLVDISVFTRLRELLSHHLPSDDLEPQIRREKARQLSEILNAWLGLVGRN